MSQYVESPCRGDTAAGAIGQHLRVKTPGALALAGASDPMIGTTEYPVLAAGPATVRLRSAQGTRKMVANGAISVGPVYAAASGKVASSGTVLEGYALTAATADNDEIEVMPASSTDVSTATTGTTASSFTVDNDSTIPKIALASQTGGTGDYTVSVKPPATLTANRTYTGPADSDQTLVGATATQTLTNKTLTTPTLTTPVISTGLSASGSAANDFSGSTGTFLTSTGTNTLGGKSVLKTIATPVAAAGSTVADAAALGAGNFLVVSSDSAAKGVKFATSVAGDWAVVINSSSTACKIYAASGGTVNGGSADAAVTVLASKGVYCISTAANTWTIYDMPAKST